MDWKTVCPDPSVDYCKNVNKYAYNNSTNHKSIQNINLGFITGVAWRPKGSVIGRSEAIPSSNIPSRVRLSDRSAYYYIIQDLKTAQVFLRQSREIDGKYEKRSKPAWKEKATVAFVQSYCNHQVYFRQCFDVTDKVCSEFVSVNARACMLNNDKLIPDTLIQPRDGMKLGPVIGQCIGQAYGASFKDKYINNARCNKLENWK